MTNARTTIAAMPLKDGGKRQIYQQIAPANNSYSSQYVDLYRVFYFPLVNQYYVVNKPLQFHYTDHISVHATK